MPTTTDSPRDAANRPRTGDAARWLAALVGTVLVPAVLLVGGLLVGVLAWIATPPGQASTPADDSLAATSTRGPEATRGSGLRPGPADSSAPVARAGSSTLGPLDQRALDASEETEERQEEESRTALDAESTFDLAAPTIGNLARDGPDRRVRRFRIARPRDPPTAAVRVS